MNFIVESYERYKNQIYIDVELIPDIINIIREYVIIDIKEHFLNIVNIKQVKGKLIHQIEDGPNCFVAVLILELNIKEDIINFCTYGARNTKFLSYLDFYTLIMKNELRTYLEKRILDATNQENLNITLYYSIIDYYNDQLNSTLKAKINKFLYDLTKSYLDVKFLNVL